MSYGRLRAYMHEKIELINIIIKKINYLVNFILPQKSEITIIVISIIEYSTWSLKNYNLLKSACLYSKNKVKIFCVGFKVPRNDPKLNY